VVARRSGPGHCPGPRAGRPRRGFVTLERALPRFVEVRRLARGSAAFYFRIPTYYRKLGCEMANEPLGTSYEAACGDDGKGGRAATLNALFDEWNDPRKGEPIEQGKIARYGTVDWLFRHPAAVAVICFEWLQRPENVVAGFLTWPDYRSKNWPHAVRIEHHKNKALVWHPLEETVDGEIIKFYAEAEDILSQLPKLGVPMIMRRIEKGERKGHAKVWSYPVCVPKT
jgi:hypothetical protein